jgi:hypothetical protein
MFFLRFIGHRRCAAVPKPIVLVYALTVFLQFVATPVPALAQWESNRATARNLAAEGNAALKLDDFATAEDRFRRADALVHAPTLVVDHARALIGLGRFVEAQERLELVLREGVPSNAPWVWKRALKDAQQLVDTVKPKLGWLTITVRGPSDSEVSMDEVQVPAVALGVRRATDPGSRRIRAKAPGYLPTEVTVSMPEGGEQAITLDLKLDPAANKSATSPLWQQSAPTSLSENRHPKKDSNVIGYVAIGVGAAGLAVGAVAGAIFLGKHSELASRCPDASNCDQTGLIDQYNRYGTISGVGLGVGLVSSLAGTWLLLSHKSHAESSSRPQSVAVAPYISSHQLGLAGVFQ